MDNLIAKKYAQAILTRKDANDFYELLQGVAGAFKFEKMQLILGSNELKKEDKFEFVLSLFQKPKANFVNFLKLLAQNSRLGLIPQIAEELGKQKALKEGIYSGTIFSKKALKKDELANLEQKLGKKFGVSIKLSNQTTDTQGIKMSLDELGYELSFSMQSLKSKMSEYILKTL